jgi:hypothetical protein
MKVTINRAPVLTLWAATVAERMGHSWETALTLGKAVAGLNAQAKGRTLGIYAAKQPGEGAAREKKKADADVQWITVCGRPVPARQTAEGVRAVAGDAAIEPVSVHRYLEKAFGDSLEQVRSAMKDLAGAYSASELESRAYGFYEKFRPSVASGTGGWGQKGDLDLDLIRSLSKGR